MPEIVLDLVHLQFFQPYVFRPDNEWPWLLTGLSEPLERDGGIACYPLGTDANNQIIIMIVIIIIKTFLMR